jgi:hypothetical protein
MAPRPCAQPIARILQRDFLWHSLIGLVTYLAMRCLILGLAAGEQPKRSNDR